MAEKEKDVVVKGRVPEGAELGAVTYVDPDKTGPVSLLGVTFVPGEAVDLDELLTEDQAQRLKSKLANNPHFKVEGGPDHSKMVEARMKHEEEAAKKRQELADKQVRAQSRGGAEGQQPPAGWKGPDQPTLESGSGERPPKRR